MIQEILTYITVIAAFIVAGRSIYKTIFSTDPRTICSGCISSGCGAKSLVTGKNIKKGTNYKTVVFRK